MIAARLLRAVAAFGRFWWDFLIGDTPEIFVVIVLALVVVGWLSLGAHAALAAGIVLPIVAVGALVHSLLRATRSR